jgi:hypothetical protein
MSHRAALAALAALSLIAPASAQDAAAPQPNRVAEAFASLAPGLDETNAGRVQILLNGYFLGVRVMKADLFTDFAGDAYEAGGVFRTAGLAGWLHDTDIEVDTFGTLGADGVEPRMYKHRNHASSKNRTVAIDFEGGVAEPVVTPDFGSHGDPPPSLEDLTGAIDPISTFVALVLKSGEQPCRRTIRVFDGKQRYDLRFEEAGADDIDLRGYEGPALRCDVYYTPVSGFDPEDLADPEDYARPMTVWLANLGEGRWAPVRIRARVSGVAVSVEAKSVSVRPEPGPGRADSDGSRPDRG